MNDYPQLLRSVLAGNDLSADDAARMIGAIMDETISPVRTAALFAALAAKGESADEIVGAARAMRERSLHVNHGLPLVIDIVGTGGDGAHTINISTAAALTVAGCGIPVAKHGNRAASSMCGSADVLEALGVSIERSPEDAAQLLREAKIAFLFARHYHPATRAVGPVRSELGVRTIFNVLGPLTNPANVNRLVASSASPRSATWCCWPKRCASSAARRPRSCTRPAGSTRSPATGRRTSCSSTRRGCAGGRCIRPTTACTRRSQRFAAATRASTPAS
jgi:anthranilate phosphoribosyltransferase